MAVERMPFGHFVEDELLEARVRDLSGRYSDEEIAATAWYLGMLSLASVGQVVNLYGDAHLAMHLLANIFAGEWLTELIYQGVVDPQATYDLAVREHGDKFVIEHPDGMEDIKSDDDQYKPMDRDTFNRLWGGNG